MAIPARWHRYSQASDLLEEPGVQTVVVADPVGLEGGLILLSVVSPGPLLIEQGRLAHELAGGAVVGGVFDAEAVALATEARVFPGLGAAGHEIRTPGGENAAIEAAEVVGELPQSLGMGHRHLSPGASHGDGLQVLGSHNGTESSRAAGVGVGQKAAGGDQVLAGGTDGDYPHIAA